MICSILICSEKKWDQNGGHAPRDCCMATMLHTTFDELVRAVALVRLKAEALMEKLQYINSDVHDGEPDLDSIHRVTLDQLMNDLPELSESAALPLDACANFAAEVARMRLKRRHAPPIARDGDKPGKGGR